MVAPAARFDGVEPVDGRLVRPPGPSAHAGGRLGRREPARIRAHHAPPARAPISFKRIFTAHGPGRLWVADITYIATGAGLLFLAVVLDAWSRRVVGWARAAQLRTELVLDALNMPSASAARPR
jgi:transposase InsO family protein